MFRSHYCLCCIYLLITCTLGPIFTVPLPLLLLGSSKRGTIPSDGQEGPGYGNGLIQFASPTLELNVQCETT
jgi:hypothetical protein